MKKAIIAVLAVALIIAVLCVFMTREPNGSTVSPVPSQTATRDKDRPLPRPPETAPVPSWRELSAQRNSHDPAPSHNVESVQVPAPAPSTAKTDEAAATLPKDHIAWSQERQMRQLLDMDPDQLAKFRADYRDWIGGKLARGAKIELTSEETRQLVEVFMDATMDFCRQWHPILQDGLAQPGESRDRLALLNAVDPDMMLMLYAIPARQNEMSEVLGSERYEKMRSIMNAEFLKWYNALTNDVETIQPEN